jgi:hypothetical protein
MKIQIDLKSALCGLIIGVAAMFVMGAESSSSNPVGKYQLKIGPTCALILNTQSGEVWGMPAGPESGSHFDNKSDKFFVPK